MSPGLAPHRASGRRPASTGRERSFPRETSFLGFADTVGRDSCSFPVLHLCTFLPAPSGECVCPGMHIPHREGSGPIEDKVQLSCLCVVAMWGTSLISCVCSLAFAYTGFLSL